MAAGLTTILSMMLAACAAGAGAQELKDPTRPAIEIGMPSVAEGPGPGPASSGLQTIYISPGRRAAIINGKTVELGAKYGEDKLVEVNERGVVLQGNQGRKALALFPGVQLTRKTTSPEKVEQHQFQKSKSLKSHSHKHKKIMNNQHKNNEPADQAIEHSEEEK